MTDQTLDDGKQQRRLRPPSLAYRQKTDAIRVVAPITEKLGLWSQRVAFLRAMANRGGIATTSASRAEAAGLLGDIRRAREDLAARTRELPPELASHGRLIDVGRSLDALETQLAEALLLLTP